MQQILNQSTTAAWHSLSEEKRQEKQLLPLETDCCANAYLDIDVAEMLVAATPVGLEA